MLGPFMVADFGCFGEALDVDSEAFYGGGEGSGHAAGGVGVCAGLAVDTAFVGEQKVGEAAAKESAQSCGYLFDSLWPSCIPSTSKESSRSYFPVNTMPFSNARHRALHSLTVPTAGGQAQDFPYWPQPV